MSVDFTPGEVELADQLKTKDGVASVDVRKLATETGFTPSAVDYILRVYHAIDANHNGFLEHAEIEKYAIAQQGSTQKKSKKSLGGGGLAGMPTTIISDEASPDYGKVYFYVFSNSELERILF